MPPPPTVLTFLQYFNFLWKQTIGKYALRKNASRVYLIFDKSDFLPPPRLILYTNQEAGKLQMPFQILPSGMML